MTDRQIIALFFARSEDAISALREKYGALCRRIAMNILRNESDAEECESDTYLRVWETVPPTDPDPLSPFVLRITRNLALDQLRRDSRLAQIPDEAVIRAETEDVERQYLKKEQALQLHDAIKRLPPDYGRVLYLVYFEDFSNAEAARVLGKTKRQVENLSYRARQALRRQLETEGFAYEGYE